MDVAELVARRSLLEALQAPGDLTVANFAIGQSVTEGLSIYPVDSGQWGIGYTERGIFSEAQVFESEDAACEWLWEDIVSPLVRDGVGLGELRVNDGSLGLRVRTTLDTTDLARFATSADLAVRANLATRHDLPPHLYETLARDKIRTVRWRVAANPALPAPLVALFASDPDARAALALNPALAAALAESLTHDTSPGTLWRIAQHPAVATARLTELAAHSDFRVRWGVAANPTTPDAALSSLARDEEYAVRLAASLGHRIY